MTRIQDLNGNCIEVAYDSASATPAFTFGEWAYPLRVDWGRNDTAGYTHIFHAKFDYESRPDVRISYRGGYAERVARRSSGIRIWADGISTATEPTRAYTFAYQQDTDTHWSQLHSVALIPALTAPPTTAPPATTFSYQVSAHRFGNWTPLPLTNGPAALNVSATMPPMPPNAPHNWPGGSLEGFMDVDGDGVLDFLAAGGFDGVALYRNRGMRLEKAPIELWVNDEVDGYSYYSYLQSPEVGLIDLDGDALPDVVRTLANVESGDPPYCPGATCNLIYYRNRSDPRVRGGVLVKSAGEWTGVPGYASLVSYPPSYFGDLNGDGRPDLLDCHAWSAEHTDCQLYPNLGLLDGDGNGGFGPAVPWNVPAAPRSGHVHNGLPSLPVVRLGGDRQREPSPTTSC